MLSEVIKGILARLFKLLFDKPLLKFVMLLFFIALTSSLANAFPNKTFQLILLILNAVFLLYLIAFIFTLLLRSFRHLLSAQSMLGLIGSYALFLLSILIVISLMFGQVAASGKGYLTYGTCGDKFDSSMISQDTRASRDYFYFTAVTFFTVGYGDICPMGLAKLLAIVTAMIGHIVSVILMVIVINNYLQRKR